jgi:hypothetical protein
MAESTQSEPSDLASGTWPPAPNRAVTIVQYGSVTLRLEPGGVDVSWRNPRRRTLWAAIVAYVLAIGCLLCQLVGNPVGTPVAQLLASLRALPEVCWGVGFGTLVFIACAVEEWRSIRTIERTRIDSGAETFVDGAGNSRPLDEIKEIIVDRNGLGYQVRMWPERRGVDGFLRAYHWFPVWNVRGKDSAGELAGIVAAAARVPVVWR